MKEKILVFKLITFISFTSATTIVDVLSNAVVEERAAFQGPNDDTSNRLEFDFIVVGGGAAGCALAARLSEEKSWSVLLLEAGGDETYLQTIPYLTSFTSKPDDWGFTMGPTRTGCVGATNGTCSYNRGRVMGGSTSINGLNFMRGNRHDYDNWAALGNTGWGWDDVLPYFRKLEDMQIPELRSSSYHGKGGPIPITYSPYKVPVTEETFAAAAELGIPRTDYNGETQEGISRIQFGQHKGGRVSANRGYLFPARRRRNLWVRKHSLVRRVLLVQGEAHGVEYERNGLVQRAYARMEVILAAGAVMSPVILMLSGLGPREHLRSLDIPVEQDLPVGDNLMDHPTFYGLIPVFKDGTFPSRMEVVSSLDNFSQYFANGTGPLSWAFIEAIRFFHVGNMSNPRWINMEAYFVFTDDIRSAKTARNLGVPDGFWKKFYKPVAQQLTAAYVVLHLRPRSRGTLRLRANNIRTPPIIDPMMLSHKQDVEELAQGVAEAARIFNTSTMRRLGVKLHDAPVPGCERFRFASMDYWRCAVRIATHNMYHPCGTAKMAPLDDPTSVVSPELKVRGIRRLRVADASIFPVIPAAHTMVPTYMVAEKAADLIKREYRVCHHCE